MSVVRTTLSSCNKGRPTKSADIRTYARIITRAVTTWNSDHISWNKNGNLWTLTKPSASSVLKQPIVSCFTVSCHKKNCWVVLCILTAVNQTSYKNCTLFVSPTIILHISEIHWPYNAIKESLFYPSILHFRRVYSLTSTLLPLSHAYSNH